jgi:hypothetical protein
MSLYINADGVHKVLLADGWHTVEDQSFDLDAYEYHRDDFVLLYGGRCDGVVSTGFSFTDADTHAPIFGPLTSILAVSYT